MRLSKIPFLFSCVLGVALTGFSQAQDSQPFSSPQAPPLPGLASTNLVSNTWNRFFGPVGGNCAGVAFGTDGSEYVGGWTGDSLFTYWTLYKFDLYGTKVWTCTTAFWGYAPMNAIGVDSSNNAYIAGAADDPNDIDEAITWKVYADGATAWIQHYLPPSMTPTEGKKVGFDTSGDVEIACSAFDISTFSYVSYNPSGVLLNSAEYLNISPQSITFTSFGYAMLTGPSNSFKGAYWSLIDPAGQIVLSHNAPTTTVGTTTTSYQYAAATDLSGGFYLAQTTTKVVNGGNPAMSHSVEAYDLNGDSIWTSPVEPGSLGVLLATDSSHVFGCDQYNFLFSSTYEMFGANGLKTWSGVITGLLIAAIDGTSGVVFQTQTGGDPSYGYQLTKYSPSGSQEWAEQYGPVANESNEVLQMISLDGVLHLEGNQEPSGSANRQLLLTNYIEGLEPYKLTFTTASNSGGGILNGTLLLNAAAPLGGFVVDLTSLNPDAIAVPASVTVPAGVNHVAFTAEAAPVDASQSVTIDAFTPTLQRTATISLTPSTLSSLTMASPDIGGTPVPAGVGLSGPCGVAGRKITITSSNSAVATVPASVSIPPYGTSAKFTITTKLVTTQKTATITVTTNGMSASYPLVVDPKP